jgi:NlpC/P60 family
MSELYCFRKRTGLKNLIPLLGLTILFMGCNALKPAVKGSQSSSSAAQNSSSEFLEDISVQSPAMKSTGAQEEPIPSIVDNHVSRLSINTTFNIETGSTIQFKYAVILDTEVEQLSNLELYKFIDNWWGTPYRMGGLTQRGIDCSAFVQSLLGTVYGIALPRVAKEQKKACEKLDQNELQEGDLVFFNTRGGVSHVGIYLHNNRFVHVATSNGVTISGLQDPYWEARYIGAGRPKNEAMAVGGK